MILDPWFWLACLGGAAAYWAVPPHFRPWVVALSTVAYLATVSLPTVAVSAFMGSVAFLAAPRAVGAGARGKWIIGGITVVFLVTLAFWKYLPDAARAAGSTTWLSSLALPLGISFYTFRLLHYAIEVGRGTLKPQAPGAFLAYLFFLPVFVAGPIAPYDQFERHRDVRPSREALVEGTTRIAHGLIKKLLLAEGLVHPRDVAEFLASNASSDTGAIWRFLMLWYVYAYLDFSAYSDLALGISRLYGVRLAENFNWPILAQSVADFWKRWHISLAAWTQRYVYMPILGRWRNPYAAVVSTFLALSLWHAATPNYLAWGLFHAAGVSTALTWARLKRVRGWSKQKRGERWQIAGRVVSTLLTFLFVSLSCAFSSTTGHGFAAGVRLFLGALGLR